MRMATDYSIVGEKPEMLVHVGAFVLLIPASTGNSLRLWEAGTVCLTKN